VPEDTSNSLSGTVSGPVVQARVIEGGIHVHPPAPAPPVTPRQLPPPPAQFVDRAEQLAVLDQIAAGCVTGPTLRNPAPGRSGAAQLPDLRSMGHPP